MARSVECLHDHRFEQAVDLGDQPPEAAVDIDLDRGLALPAPLGGFARRKALDPGQPDCRRLLGRKLGQQGLDVGLGPESALPEHELVEDGAQGVDVRTRVEDGGAPIHVETALRVVGCVPDRDRLGPRDPVHVRQLEADEVLEDHADPTSPGFGGDTGDVDTT